MTRMIPAAAVAAFLLALPALASTIPAEIHVAIVGDSLARGEGDEEARGIAGRLEDELRDRGFGTVATTNFAATGATTRDFRFLLRQPGTRSALAAADAIVLSIGANDLRDAFLRERPASPLVIIDRVLRDIGATVAELHEINPEARILVLGGYTPVALDRAASLLEPLIALWDAALMAQFASDDRVTIVRMSDILDRPGRLSTLDSFHPGAEAYQETARRIAELLVALRS